MIENAKMSAQMNPTEGSDTSSEMDFVNQKRVIKEVMVRFKLWNLIRTFI